MKNRDVLHNMCLYDLLLKMHEYMMNKAPSCVLEPLGKKCDVTIGRCDECIAAWLNEGAEKDE